MSKKSSRLDNEQQSYEDGPAGNTDVVVRTSIKNTTAAPVQVSPSGLLLFNDSYDEIQVTYPTTTTEAYAYKLATVTVATVTITYTDTTKRNIQSVIKT